MGTPNRPTGDRFGESPTSLHHGQRSTSELHSKVDQVGEVARGGRRHHGRPRTGQVVGRATVVPQDSLTTHDPEHSSYLTAPVRSKEQKVPAGPVTVRGLR